MGGKEGKQQWRRLYVFKRPEQRGRNSFCVSCMCWNYDQCWGEDDDSGGAGQGSSALFSLGWPPASRPRWMASAGKATEKRAGRRQTVAPPQSRPGRQQLARPAAGWPSSANALPRISNGGCREWRGLRQFGAFGVEGGRMPFCVIAAPCAPVRDMDPSSIQHPS